MNKLFRPKCLRRVLLFLALLFPIIYLCGGLFFALAGAHGENILATDETSIVDRKNLDFNQLEIGVDDFTRVENGLNISVSDNQYNINGTTINGSFNTILLRNTIVLQNGHKYLINNHFTSTVAPSWSTFMLYGRHRNIDYNLQSSLIFTGSNERFVIRFVTYEANMDVNVAFNFQLFDLTQMYGAGNEPTIQDFLNQFPEYYYSYTLSTPISIPIYGIPNEQNSLFFHVFGQRNFISQLGKDLVDGSTKGFNPMNELFRSINTNIMHFDVSDNLAMFGLGYVYYAVNVLIVYEILILAVKLIMLPLKAVDLFDKEDKL